MRQIRQSDVEWSLKTFNSLRDGGRWAVPRSGLIFKRVGGKLELHDVMPWLHGMDKVLEAGADIPGSPDELRRYQMDDFALIQSAFEMAGIEITDPRALLIERNITVEDLQKAIKQTEAQL